MKQQKKSQQSIKTTLAVACLLGNLNPFDSVRADQPVHCLRDDVFGTWDFHINSQINTVNLFQTNELCTHQLPNKVQVIGADYKFSFPQEEIYRTMLLDGYKAQAQKCQSKGKCEGGEIIDGTWSTIYDQAFRVELNNGQRFITNFRYNIKSNISDNPLSDGASRFSGITAGDYINFDSKCNESMVGFVQQVHGNGNMKQHHGQCFYAQQVEHMSIQKSVEEEKDGVKIDRIVEKGGQAQKSQSLAADEDANLIAESIRGEGHEVTAEGVALIQKELDAEKEEKSKANKTSASGPPPDEQNIQISSFLGTRKTHRRYNTHLEHVPSDETDLLISTINEMDLGWKADTCKYQKHHPNYGSHCDQEELLLAQTSSQPIGEVQFGEGANFQQSLELAQKYQKAYGDADSIPDSELPENFDWRNVGGYNFMNEHRDQGHCGSCYTVSFTQIAENRLKIKYGKDMPKLSAQHLMTCNYMNEGCDGGWPFFHGFFTENAYLITEDCAPYLGKTKGDKCANYEKCEPHSKIQNTYFVGKGYGDATEKKMMKEIMRNGAVNGEMQAPRVFSMYNEGIFTAAGIQKLHKKVHGQSLAQTEGSDVTDKNLASYGISWQNLNHSIVILGWGVDPETKQKYWICRNSYGSRWGDQGDFMIARGNDEFAIESETTAYDPVLCTDTQC